MSLIDSICFVATVDKMLLVKLLATFLLPIVSSLHLPIERNGKECFTVQVEPFHTTLSLTYSILNDEDATIHVQLTDQFRNAVIFYKNDAEGRYVHKVTNPGLYELCLSNTIQAVHTLFVGFSLHPEEPNRDVLSNADAGTIAHAQKVEDLVYDMNVDLDMVRDTLSYMKTKGGIHQTCIYLSIVSI